MKSAIHIKFEFELTVKDVRSPLQLYLHLVSRHETRPPSDLSLGFVVYVLLIHPGSVFILKVEGILLFSSTERNHTIFVCTVKFLQCGGSDRGLRVTIFLDERKNTNYQAGEKCHCSVMSDRIMLASHVQTLNLHLWLLKFNRPVQTPATGHCHPSSTRATLLSE